MVFAFVRYCLKNAFLICVMILPCAQAGSVTPLPSRSAIFSAPAYLRPAVSASGKWLAVWLPGQKAIAFQSRVDAVANKSVTLPDGAQVLWYHWLPDDFLLLHTNTNGTDGVFKINPVTGTMLSHISEADESMLVLASPVNNYGFSHTRMRNRQTGQSRDLTPAGQWVAVSDSKNSLPAYLPQADAWFGYTLKSGSLILSFGKDEQTRANLRLTPADRQQGSALVSVAPNLKAYVLSAMETDTLALYEIDTQTGESKKLAQEKTDIRRVLINPLDMQPDAVEFETTEPRITILRHAITPDISWLQARGQGFPSVVDRSPNDQFWVIRFAHRDGAPIWAVYDRLARKMQTFSPDLPTIVGDIDWRVRGFSLQKAGQPEISGYVTLPRVGVCETKACPAVLLLHGGPGVRNIAEFDPQRWWLTSRGIIVVTVNYRGSKGFGKTYLNLDRRQWAEGIPADVMAALDFVLPKFPIDKTRLALVGTSFSGFLSLHLLANTEPRFKCAAIDSSATDMVHFADWHFARNKEKSDLLIRLGDTRIPDEKAALVTMSPSNNLAKLKNVMLLQLHGLRDMVTPAVGNEGFSEWMLANNSQYTLVTFPEDGHGLLASRGAYYAITEQFLAACLGVQGEPVHGAENAVWQLRGNKSWLLPLQ